MTKARKTRSSTWLRGNFVYVLPLLVAVYSVVSVYVSNQNQLYYPQLIRPIAVHFGVVLALLGAVWMIFKQRYRAVLLTSLIIFVMFDFIELYDQIVAAFHRYGIRVEWLTDFRAVLLYCALGIVLFFIALRRSKHSWQRPAELATVLFIALLASNLYNIMSYQLANAHFDQTPLSSPLSSAKASATNNKPDIYYIILDRYASQETLASHYRTGDATFLSFLFTKGFTINQTAHANYPFTIQSITSSLNGQYLPALSAQEQKSVTSTHLLQDMIAQNGVAQFLKQQGYSYTQVGSWWDPTRNNPYADASLKSPREVVLLNHHLAVSDFEAVLLRKGIIQTIMGREFRIGGWLAFGTTTIPSDKLHAQSALYELNQLKALSKQSSNRPKFVFAHILLPHPPYVFDANGDSAYLEKDRREDSLYLQQMQFTNKQMTEVINSLTANSSKQPVIMLQADEGPYPKRFDGNTTKFNWNKATDGELQQKTGILDAFYLPGKDSSAVYPGISPVNSFRTILNLYFGTSLPILEDKHYIDNAMTPYKFIDLTSKLK